MPKGGVPRVLHSSLTFATAAANAWLRGLSIPRVALHYRYEPLTALNLIWRMARLYGRQPGAVRAGERLGARTNITRLLSTSIPMLEEAMRTLRANSLRRKDPARTQSTEALT